MATVEAKWSGKWPCLCYGEWTLIVDGVDVSDKIPEYLKILLCGLTVFINLGILMIVGMLFGNSMKMDMNVMHGLKII